MASKIETNMVGVERIKEYQEIKEEAPLEMPGQDPTKTGLNMGSLDLITTRLGIGKAWTWCSRASTATLDPEKKLES